MTKQQENSNDGNEMKLRDDNCPVCVARSIFDTVGFILFYPIVASLVAAAIVAIWVTNSNLRDTVRPNTPIEVVTKTNKAPIKLVIQEPTALKSFNGGAGPF